MKKNILLYTKNAVFMKKVIPSYILEKKNIIKLIVFVTFFVLTFVVIFKPFNSNKGRNIDEYVIYTTIMLAIGLSVFVGSRILMYRLRNKIIFYYRTFIVWVSVEITLISFACSLFYWLNDARDVAFFTAFPKIFLYTIAILFLPYSISFLYLELKEKNKVLERIKSTHNKSDTEKQPNEESNLIHFSDDRGNLKLSVSINNLFFIEADDNYVKICYINKEKVTHFILRNSLKNIEETFSDINLIRCHRSYIINPLKVKVMRRDKDGLFIELDAKSLPDIPVSKTYSQQVISLFSNASS